MLRGLWRVLIRSLLLPGSASVAGALMQYFFVFDPNHLNPASLLGQNSIWIVYLVFAVSMRRRNGLRGLHEFLSGTRVVRHRVNAATIGTDVPQALPVVDDSMPETVGPYRITGQWRRTDDTAILRGRDDDLQRDVLVHLGDGPIASSPHPRRVDTADAAVLAAARRRQRRSLGSLRVRRRGAVSRALSTARFDSEPIGVARAALARGGTERRAPRQYPAAEFDVRLRMAGPRRQCQGARCAGGGGDDGAPGHVERRIAGDRRVA